MNQEFNSILNGDYDTELISMSNDSAYLGFNITEYRAKVLEDHDIDFVMRSIVYYINLNGSFTEKKLKKRSDDVRSFLKSNKFKGSGSNLKVNDLTLGRIAISFPEILVATLIRLDKPLRNPALCTCFRDLGLPFEDIIREHSNLIMSGKSAEEKERNFQSSLAIVRGNAAVDRVILDLVSRAMTTKKEVLIPDRKAAIKKLRKIAVPKIDSETKEEIISQAEDDKKENKKSNLTMADLREMFTTTNDMIGATFVNSDGFLELKTDENLHDREKKRLDNFKIDDELVIMKKGELSDFMEANFISEEVGGIETYDGYNVTDSGLIDRARNQHPLIRKTLKKRKT